MNKRVVPNEMMSLKQSGVGLMVRIQSIPDDETALLAMRMGISVGETVKVLAKVPGGPVVIQRGETEIALGSEIAQGIEVQPI